MTIVSITGSFTAVSDIATQHAAVTAEPIAPAVGDTTSVLSRKSWRLPENAGALQLPAGTWLIRVSPTGSGERYFSTIAGVVTLTADITWPQLVARLRADSEPPPPPSTLAALVADNVAQHEQLLALGGTVASLTDTLEELAALVATLTSGEGGGGTDGPVPLLTPDPVLAGYFVPTGLTPDPSLPGYFYPDGLVEDPSLPGYFLIGATP